MQVIPKVSPKLLTIVGGIQDLRKIFHVCYALQLQHNCTTNEEEHFCKYATMLVVKNLRFGSIKETLHFAFEFLVLVKRVSSGILGDFRLVKFAQFCGTIVNSVKEFL